MHKALNPRDDIDRLYVSRKDGGKWLANIEDSVDALIQRPEDYIEKHGGGLITSIRNDNDNTMDNRMTTRKGKCGPFKQLIYISYEKTWTRMRKVNFTRETSLLIAAQNNDVRTNNI